MEHKSIHSLLTPSECALAVIDYQPAMFSGVHSHDRTTIVQNIQILSKAAKLFKVPTIRRETYEGCMDILKAHSPYGIEVRFVKVFLGGHGEGTRLRQVA